jgi:PadR family transcriptional regulator, regulatory protein AphA
MLKYALLGFLSYRPMTGYELEGFMNVSTGNFWHAKLSQIYMTLKKLEEEKFVTSRVEAQESRPDRRVYTITDSGRVDLQDWLLTPIVEHEFKKDSLLLKLFFSSPGDKETILTQLRLQLDLHRRKMLEYRHETAQVIGQMINEQPELTPNALLWEQTRRYGEMYEETYVRWLEETIATLDHLLAGK